MIIKGRAINDNYGAGILVPFNYEIKNIPDVYTSIDELIIGVREDITSFVERQRFGIIGENILSVQLAFLEDETFLNKVKEYHKATSLSSAIISAVAYFIDLLYKTGSQVIMSRNVDLLDLQYRLLAKLAKCNIYSIPEFEDCLLCVKRLTPSLLLYLPSNVKGIIVEEFAALSHPALIVNKLDIPILLIEGMRFAFNQKGEISGGSLYINEVNVNKRNIGVAITKYVAINSSDDLDLIARFSGVGLVRTEYFMQKYKTDDKIIEMYKRIITEAQGKPAYFRFYDMDSDKGNQQLISQQRGIAYLLSNPQLIYKQIEHFRGAGVQYLYFPFVESEMEIAEVLQTYDDLQYFTVGAMIESRSGVRELLAITKKVSFIMLGTNDLTASYFGVGRNKEVDLTDKGLFEFIESILHICGINNINIGVCGQLTHQITYQKLFLRYGVRFIVL